ncbi:MAG TPA: hypothetical protein VJ065_03185 [Patescibacteria group bacterium]|nr:hypothetical protein [Patescibacteria group bacterium]
MKQLSIIDVLDAFSDEPISIGDRLVILGFKKDETAKAFSKSLLEAKVYGSSFLKFLQDNAAKLPDTIGVPPQPLPDGFANPYDSGPKTIGQRLTEIGMAENDKSEMFDRDTLNLSVGGEEFTEFLVRNQKKLLGKIEQMAMKEGQ